LRALSAVAVAAACGPVDDGPLSRAPVNACGDESACTLYDQKPQPTCQAGACTVGGLIPDLALVVSVPDGALNEAGATFIIKYADLLVQTHKDPACPLGARCARLPSVGQIAGAYVVDTQTAKKEVHFSVGDEGINHSLPVRASFRPAWVFGDGAPIDVGLLSMDLQPVFGVPLSPRELPYPGPGYKRPDQTLPAPIAWSTVLADQTYEETLELEPPFDQAFPPYVSTITFGGAGARSSSDFANVLFAFDPNDKTYTPPPVANHPVAVSRAGGQSLEGWTLFLRDDRTKRRISSTAPLHEAATVQINTTLQTAAGGSADSIRADVSLVLAPPAGAKLPELVHAVLGDGVVPQFANYPLLPSTVTLQGFVAGADGTPVPAGIVLESTELEVLDEDSTGRDLQFVDVFETTPQATYERELPPGKYKAIITPRPTGPTDPAASYAKSVVDLVISPPQQPGDRLQAGRKLEVAKSIILRGTCTTTDGRALAEAEVEAHAAGSLRYADNDDDRDPLRWPRVVRTPTNASGGFVLPVDPQMTYDIVVRPASNSRLPWALLPQVTVPTPADLQIKVGAPIAISLLLHDEKGQPAASALVRAFRGLAASNPNNPKVAVEIGRARTDGEGRLQLYLDGRP
jgi:hypothetical protein